MFEKVNPGHPDKIADRIAGALVDMAYAAEHDPRIAVEVLIGHGKCHIIAETSVTLHWQDVADAVHRIADDDSMAVDYTEVPQDPHLAHNQEGKLRCGDNGIFRGVPVTQEQHWLSMVAQELYAIYKKDAVVLRYKQFSEVNLAIFMHTTPLSSANQELPAATPNPESTDELSTSMLTLDEGQTIDTYTMEDESQTPAPN